MLKNNRFTLEELKIWESLFHQDYISIVPTEKEYNLIYNLLYKTNKTYIPALKEYHEFGLPKKMSLDLFIDSQDVFSIEW